MRTETSPVCWSAVRVTFFFFLWGLVAFQHDFGLCVSSGTVTAESVASLQRCQAEVQAAANAYQQFGLSRRVRMYSEMRVDKDPVISATVDWSEHAPSTTVNELFLRHGERFRMDRILQNKVRSYQGFDGKVARQRINALAINQPAAGLRTGSGDAIANLLPHCLLNVGLDLPSMGWVFGSTVPMQRSAYEGGKGSDFECEPDSYKGSDGWRVRWLAQFGSDSHMVYRCEAFLASKYSALPVYQRYQLIESGEVRELVQIYADQFQRSEHDGLWYPKRVIGTRAKRNDEVDVFEATYAWNDSFADLEQFSDLPVSEAALKKPVKATVAAFTPQSLLDEMPGNILPLYYSSMEEFQRFWIWVLVYLIVMFAMLVCFIRYTGIGRWLRNCVADHPSAFCCGGLLLALPLAYLASQPLGWSSHGLTLIITGAFLLVWMGLVMFVSGQYRITMRMSLALSVTCALIFSGLSVGHRRVAPRSNFIADLQKGGGKVVTGAWLYDDDRLFLPPQLEPLVGPAWRGKTSQAVVMVNSLQHGRPEHWSLDEVRWLGIASPTEDGFVLDASLINRMPSSENLWTLKLQKGGLTDDGIEKLKRFPRLVDLSIDCEQQDMPESITELKSLERLTLTHATVDAALLSCLAQMECLQVVNLIKPVFDTTDQPPAFDQYIEELHVQFASLDGQAFELLGAVAETLQVVDCKCTIGVDEAPQVSKVEQLTIGSSEFGNLDLNRIRCGESLRWMRLRDTNVNIEGIDQYSMRYPSASLTLETRR